MSYVIGVAGLLGLAAVYVGLGLADRGGKGCGGCVLRDLDAACGGCTTEAAATLRGAEREAGAPDPAPRETEREPRKGEGEPRTTGERDR